MSRGSFDGWQGGARTPDPVINSHLLYRLSYSPTGASNRNRTHDILITSEALYLLSYAGIVGLLLHQ